MRIYMQKAPGYGTAPRFYHLFVQQDLLEDWMLISETGAQGSAGRVKREHYATRSDAEKALIALRDAQIKRGYHVVFMQGTYN